MITNIVKLLTSEKSKKDLSDKQKVISYYEETSEDYRDWSENYNMHFGYFEKSMGFKKMFDVESMLQNMNQQVLSRLQLKKKQNHVLDMGSGFGATARYITAHNRTISVTGISLVPWQIERSKQLAENIIGGKRRMTFEVRDYEKTELESEAYDGVYALESICHGAGKDKQKVIQEMYRVCKKGGSIVIADGFIKSQKKSPVFEWIYRQVCDGWAVKEFAHIEPLIEALTKQGFNHIKVNEVFNNIAPSAAAIPIVVAKYCFKRVVFSKRFYQDASLRKQRLKHLKASFLSMFLGLCKKNFGYYMISAEK